MVTFSKLNHITVIIDDKGFIKATELSMAFYERVYRFLKDEETQSTIECLRGLGQKDVNVYSKCFDKNHNGVYINPFLVLKFASIKKCQDKDYTESFEFLRKTIFEWIEQNNKQKELEYLYDFYHEEGDFYEG